MINKKRLIFFSILLLSWTAIFIMFWVPLFQVDNLSFTPHPDPEGILKSIDVGGNIATIHYVDGRIFKVPINVWLTPFDYFKFKFMGDRTSLTMPKEQIDTSKLFVDLDTITGYTLSARWKLTFENDTTLIFTRRQETKP